MHTLQIIGSFFGISAQSLIVTSPEAASDFIHFLLLLSQWSHQPPPVLKDSRKKFGNSSTYKHQKMTLHPN